MLYIYVKCTYININYTCTGVFIWSAFFYCLDFELNFFGLPFYQLDIVYFLLGCTEVLQHLYFLSSFTTPGPCHRPLLMVLQRGIHLSWQAPDLTHNAGLCFLHMLTNKPFLPSGIRHRNIYLLSVHRKLAL